MGDNEHNQESAATVFDVTSEAFVDAVMEQPDPADITSVYQLPELTITDGNDTFTARVIGFGTSYREGHKDHRPGTKPDKRCAACRWSDVAIMRPVDADMYVVAVMGKSALDGEECRKRIYWVEDAMSVLRNLTVRGRSDATRPAVEGRQLPNPNAMAFREAAEVDAGIRAIVEEFDDAIPHPLPDSAGFPLRQQH